MYNTFVWEPLLKSIYIFQCTNTFIWKRLIKFYIFLCTINLYGDIFENSFTVLEISRKIMKFSLMLPHVEIYMKFYQEQLKEK